MDYLYRSLTAVLVMMMLFTGCATQTDVGKVNYVVGDTETVRVVKTNWHKSWVDMPNKPKQQINQKKRITEIMYTTKVDSVDEDGSALLTVTFGDVMASVVVDTTSKKETNTYTSNKDKTKTTANWPTEPKLSGESFQLKVASNSEILEMITLDALRKKLKVTKKTGIVSGILSEKSIKKMHEHRHLIDDIENGQVVTVVVPDAMIKEAKAIERTYNVANDGETVLTSYSGEAVYVLPEGWAKPPKPSHPGLGMIVAMSEIDTLEINGEASYNISRGRVDKDNQSVKCVLLLLSKDLSAQFNKGKKSDGGEMYTVSELSYTFEVIK